MTGKPVLAPSEREKVLLPDPAIPVTTTRRPIAKPASLICVSIPQVPFREQHTAASTSWRAQPTQLLLHALSSATRSCQLLPLGWAAKPEWLSHTLPVHREEGNAEGN